MKFRFASLVLCLSLAAAPSARALELLDISQADIRGLSVNPLVIVEAVGLFSEGLQIYRNVTARQAKHARELAAKGIAEEPASQAAVHYRIDTGRRTKMLFDDWGELYIDRRFLTDAELVTVKRIESFIWDNVIVPLQQAKVLSADEKRPDMQPSAAQSGAQRPAKPGTAAKPAPLKKRAPRVHAGGAGLPIFRGFEDDRYQQYDALIAKMTADFNANKAKWCGGNPDQAAKIKDLTPAQVKSHMIEETGGSGPRSKAAWAVDPLQINVPGDWGAEKEALGLTKPTKRNEGTAEQNVRAAIMYLSRKGFGSSGRPAAVRPKGFFDGWPTALTRYNGRRDRTETDRFYSEEYSDKILKRAQNPDLFVPIEIKLKK